LSAAAITAKQVELRATESRFVLHTPHGAIAIALPLPGRHNVLNALAAATIAAALEIPLATIKAGLEGAQHVKGRLVRHDSRAGWSLIDDSYNANPGSTAAAIATLTLEAGPAWLVLGDMKELGADAEKLHADIGLLAKKSGVERLYTVGALARAASLAFGAGAHHHTDQTALIAALRADLQSGVRCLVKGSRSSAMDRVVAALLHDNGDAHAA
jgi:UDP-N-acetylmuramoyl-tripeptide--D-alanyl-D-alanine ligase